MDDFPAIEKATALLIIDVQKGFINQHTAHIPEKIEDLQKRYPLVFATKFFNLALSPFRTLLHWNRFDKGSEETALAFPAAKNVIILEKTSYGSSMTGYFDILSRNGIKTVHIVGLDTNMCVFQSAVELFESGQYRPVVLAPFCASHSGAAYHDNALKLIEKAIGQEQIWTG